MSLLLWVVAGILLYWVAMIIVDREGLLPASVKLSGPVTTIRTQRGRALLNTLAQPRRFWRAWANLGVGIALVVMVASFLVLVTSAIVAAFSPAASSVQNPQDVLVIPGVNQFLPLEVAPEIILGLVIGLVVHEGGHGLLCRVENIEIKSMGVALLAFIPLGAFVEPDEDSTETASRGAQTRMFAAGVTNNFAVAVLAFALLFGPVAGSIAVASGAHVGAVIPGGAADASGIEDGDRITHLQGEPVADAEEFERRLEETETSTVTVRVNDGPQRTVERSLLVTAATGDAPSPIEEGARLLSVDGVPMSTVSELREYAATTEVVTARYDAADGGIAEATFPLGSFVTVDDGPLSTAGVAEGADIVIVSIGGERVIDTSDLQDVLDGHAPGEVVTVAYREGDARHEVSVELGADDDGDGFLGVFPAPGVTGLSVSDFGIREYPADQYLALLGGGDAEDDPIGIAESFLAKMVFAVFLPLASVFAGSIFPFNFPGFTADTSNFFVLEGPLSLFGGGTFLLANALFWTAWVNLNLGFFNCIPAIPLDGGHLLRSSVESVLARTPLRDRPRLVPVIVGAIAILMLASFLVVIFGNGLLAG